MVTLTITIQQRMMHNCYCEFGDFERAHERKELMNSLKKTSIITVEEICLPAEATVLSCATTLLHPSGKTPVQSQKNNVRA